MSYITDDPDPLYTHSRTTRTERWRMRGLERREVEKDQQVAVAHSARTIPNQVVFTKTVRLAARFVNRDTTTRAPTPTTRDQPFIAHNQTVSDADALSA
jgi:hypothetical protein